MKAEAQITKITTTANTTTVELEWGGPYDLEVHDFDLTKLGEVVSYGGDLRRGWVVLEGKCALKEGDTIPLLTEVE